VLPDFPRFCGQTFLEAKDRELALLCVEAYNDWNGRAVVRPEQRPSRPAHPNPPVGRRARRRRGAPQRRARGPRRVLQRDPALPRLPSVHDPNGYWDPFFAACAETETVVNMHIGSSSKMPRLG